MSQNSSAKKPKLSTDKPSENGHSAVHQNGNSHHPSTKIVCAEMAFYCFETLLNYFNKHYEAASSSSPLLSFADGRYPLFVSWHSGKERRLRGCIGTFTPLNLHQGLKEYAITSATKDSRFEPIQVEEVHKLTVSVSLLINFEEANDYLDWDVGTHGVRIEFVNEKGHHRTATYLPEVCMEQGWSKVQTIDSLLRKGGYKEHISPQFRSSIKLLRYQSEKLEVSYNEYTAFLNSKKKK